MSKCDDTAAVAQVPTMGDLNGDGIPDVMQGVGGAIRGVGSSPRRWSHFNHRHLKPAFNPNLKTSV
jgi:hypothetical protein